MKKLLFLTIAIFFSAWIYAQEIIVQHNDKGMFVSHTVAAKETFYSLGRLYAIPPKDIAAFNGLEMEGGLNIGQLVNIPLTSANFSQDAQKGHPVYYVVGEKEGLYRVSVNNNKVLMAKLRKWNDLKSDAISTGQKLIVGYINSSELVTAAAKIPTQERRDPPKVAEETSTTIIMEEPPLKKEVTKEKRPEQPKVSTVAANDGSGGYFRSSFDQQVKNQPLRKDEMSTAGIFKTASGWQDAKYYALIDGVEPGTIIRIVNPANNKAVYAKVLDKMTGVRQNQGYTLRISNAAATALDIPDTDKFSVRVNY